MPNRIDKKFAELKAAGKKALITYIVAGDGGYELTEQAVLEIGGMVEIGAQNILIGDRQDPRDFEDLAQSIVGQIGAVCLAAHEVIKIGHA